MSGIKGRSGRKKNTLTQNKTRLQLAQLYPIALDVIRDNLNGTLDDKARVDNAWNIIRQIDGLPKAKSEVTTTIAIYTPQMLIDSALELKRLRAETEALKLEYR